MLKLTKPNSLLFTIDKDSIYKKETPTPYWIPFLTYSLACAVIGNTKFNSNLAMG